MNDEDIKNYTNKTSVVIYLDEKMIETHIRNSEEDTLRCMKLRQEKFPSEKNDSEWLEYTNFVCRRRCQRVVSEDEFRPNKLIDVPLRAMQLEVNKMMSKVLDAMENGIK